MLDIIIKCFECLHQLIEMKYIVDGGNFHWTISNQLGVWFHLIQWHILSIFLARIYFASFDFFLSDFEEFS